MRSDYFEKERDLDESFVVSPPNAFNTCEPHFHRQFEILYVVQGKNALTVNGETALLGPGDFGFADSYDIHSAQSYEGCLSVSIILPYAVMGRYLKIRDSRSFVSNFVTGETAALFHPVFGLLQRYRGNTDLLLQSLGETFLGLLLRTVPLEPSNRKPAELIYQILNFLEENFKSDLSLETIALHFGYNKHYFSKLFHSYFHCNFNTYINTLRARNAHRLIEREGASVLNAAFDSGFKSMPTFYRAYSKLYRQ